MLVATDTGSNLTAHGREPDDNLHSSRQSEASRLMLFAYHLHLCPCRIRGNRMQLLSETLSLDVPHNHTRGHSSWTLLRGMQKDRRLLLSLDSGAQWILSTNADGVLSSVRGTEIPSTQVEALKLCDRPEQISRLLPNAFAHEMTGCPIQLGVLSSCAASTRSPRD